METNPEFFPAYINQEEFLKDETEVTQLSRIANLVKQITVDVEYTFILSGSEALQEVMLYNKNSLKACYNNL